MKERINLFSFTWGKSGVFDLWTIVHTSWGAIFGATFSMFGWSFNTAFIITIILLIIWEVFEYAINILELMPNVIADVIVGIAGFWILFTYLPSEGNMRFLILAILVTLALVLGYTGWRNWSNR